MVYCPSCGYEMADDAAFCMKCGTRLADFHAGEEPPQPVAQPVPPPEPVQEPEEELTEMEMAAKAKEEALAMASDAPSPYALQAEAAGLKPGEKLMSCTTCGAVISDEFEFSGEKCQSCKNITCSNCGSLGFNDHHFYYQKEKYDTNSAICNDCTKKAVERRLVKFDETTDKILDLMAKGKVDKAEKMRLSNLEIHPELREIITGVKLTAEDKLQPPPPPPEIEEGEDLPPPPPPPEPPQEGICLRCRQPVPEDAPWPEVHCQTCKFSICQKCSRIGFEDHEHYYTLEGYNINKRICNDCHTKAKNKMLQELEEIRARIEFFVEGNRNDEVIRLVDLYEETYPELAQVRVKPKVKDDDIYAFLSEDFENSIDMQFRLVPAGRFIMGNVEKAKTRDFPNEFPRHKVAIKIPFYIGVYPVTKDNWKSIMGSRPWRKQKNIHKGGGSPVVYVSWKDAKEFIVKLNQLEGGSKYRLPTETEWEYACRAGEHTRFNFGNDPKDLPDNAWFGLNTFEKGNKYAHLCGQKYPNKFGLYDMHGNVREWCEDRWHPNYAGAPNDGSAWEEGGGNERILRGGGWDFDIKDLLSSSREKELPDYIDSNIGIRLVRDI